MVEAVAFEVLIVIGKLKVSTFLIHQKADFPNLSIKVADVPSMVDLAMQLLLAMSDALERFCLLLDNWNPFDFVENLTRASLLDHFVSEINCKGKLFRICGIDQFLTVTVCSNGFANVGEIE